MSNSERPIQQAKAQPLGERMKKLLADKDLLAVTGGASPGRNPPPARPTPRGPTG